MQKAFRVGFIVFFEESFLTVLAMHSVEPGLAVRQEREVRVNGEMTVWPTNWRAMWLIFKLIHFATFERSGVSLSNKYQAE